MDIEYSDETRYEITPFGVVDLKKQNEEFRKTFEMIDKKQIDAFQFGMSYNTNFNKKEYQQNNKVGGFGQFEGRGLIEQLRISGQSTGFGGFGLSKESTKQKAPKKTVKKTVKKSKTVKKNKA